MVGWSPESPMVFILRIPGSESEHPDLPHDSQGSGPRKQLQRSGLQWYSCHGQGTGSQTCKESGATTCSQHGGRDSDEVLRFLVGQMSISQKRSHWSLRRLEQKTTTICWKKMSFCSKFRFFVCWFVCHFVCFSFVIEKTWKNIRCLFRQDDGDVAFSGISKVTRTRRRRPRAAGHATCLCNLPKEPKQNVIFESETTNCAGVCWFNSIHWYSFIWFIWCRCQRWRNLCDFHTRSTAESHGDDTAVLWTTVWLGARRSGFAGDLELRLLQVASHL